MCFYVFWASGLALVECMEAACGSSHLWGDGWIKHHSGYWTSFMTHMMCSEEDMQKMQAMAPLLRNFNLLPGDFAFAGYGGNMCLQLLSVGMKLYGHQAHMYKHAPLMGGHELWKTEGIISWLLDAACLARDPVCVENHGQASRTTGPIPFLKQLGILTKAMPFSGAVPIQSPSKESYYVSLRPCERLEAVQKAILKEWPNGTPCNFCTARELLEFTRTLGGILHQNLIHCNLKYTALQLARKVALARCSPPAELDIGTLTLKDLRRASPDHTGQLSRFPDDMPVGVLQETFGIWAPHWSMYRCLLFQVVQSPAWIRNHLDVLQRCLEDFRCLHNFNPSPRILCNLAEVVVRQTRSPSVPASRLLGVVCDCSGHQSTSQPGNPKGSKDNYKTCFPRKLRGSILGDGMTLVVEID